MPFPLDVKYIVETEEELEVFFPEHFKAKMIKENGGPLATQYDYWHLYPFFDQSNHKRISRTCNHIGLETRLARNWRNFPADAIAIASNGSGDHLVLLPISKLNKQLSDAIFTWYHETGKTEKVAERIDELLDK
ncbi:SMI1/KNR4 family protein [Niabella yanshanensis]|uniref:SMI1/KNR4 family protein n=1 Tax=Niabella yanshanensis TaxID=577386 RepID=A0ABZ0VZG1_9BACT|nr:SMI1/KNR4 family protein [Niabella yanshanensis]WQD36337.1 SMI1/KNR4 family protein [Niabella yanshanensis]